MPTPFFLNPMPNSLAVIVLAALIYSWVGAIGLVFKSAPIQTGSGRHIGLMLVFSMLGMPALLDLLQTSGMAFAFAALACLVMVANIAALSGMLFEKPAGRLSRVWSTWSIPVLVAGALAVAGYFVFLEWIGGPVLCGPAKGCEAVQNSRYAMVFGVVPMGMFGFAGDMAVLFAWLLWQIGPRGLEKTASICMWAFCMFGVLFSIYLTFLEPFVIGSTCMWCITSAVFMMLLLWSATPAAQRALAVDQDG